MKRSSALTWAYILDGKGGGRNISWEELNQWTPEQGILWAHLNFTSQKSKTWLRKQLPKIEFYALTAEDIRPRSIVHPDSILVFLRGVNLNPRQDPEDMVSIRIFINENMIITTHRRNLISANDLAESLEKNIGPTSPGEFLTMINDRLVQRMEDVIEDITDAVDSLEDEMLTIESRELRSKISDIRRQAIVLRRYLSPQRDAVNRLIIEKTKFLNLENIQYLREVNDRLIRYIEDLDSARERASITHEELSNRLTEKMESRMYLLSIVAVIFLPLTFITGLLGINVGGIPGSTNSNAFYIVSGICAIVSIILFIIFRRKKWL